jgi:integrase
VKGKGGPYGKKTKVRVVPMSNRVRALLEHHFALEKTFPVKTRRAQDIVKNVAIRDGITKDVSPHVLRHTFATMAFAEGDPSADSPEDPRARPASDHCDLSEFHKYTHPGRVGRPGRPDLTSAFGPSTPPADGRVF